MLTSSLGFPKPSEVVVLGSVAVDFVAYTSSLPQLGETVLGSSFSKNFGGKGANQVVLIAVIGKFISWEYDHFGELLATEQSANAISGFLIL